MAAWEEKAKLPVSKGPDDLAKAALQERRAVEDRLRVVEERLGPHLVNNAKHVKTFVSPMCSLFSHKLFL